MTPEEMRQVLVDNFTVEGTIGGRLKQVYDAEDHVQSYLVNNFHGQNVFFDSFQAFFVETLNTCYQLLVSKGWPNNSPNYSLAVVHLANLFRRVRACEVLYCRGYPLDAYALMRDVKDRCFLLAGVCHNMTTFIQLLGAPATPIPDKREFQRQSTRNRKNNEHRITNRFMGSTSGLPTDVQEDLKSWDDFFHIEMHGGSISFTQEIKELVQGNTPQIGPSATQDGYVLYINRSAELSWMILRLMPFFQPLEGAFGAEWERKRRILDGTCRYLVEELGNLGKKVAVSFIAMMDDKFVFQEPLYYFEADGSVR